MSRHRAVRNLNLDEELAQDDYYSDEDPYETISPDDQYALSQALSQVLAVLGPSHATGIPERDIKDALWDSYFDVDSALNHLLEQKSRNEARLLKQRQKDGDDGDPTSQGAEPLSALQRLSLRSGGTSSGGGGGGRGRGRGRGALRGKAMGLAGLGTGGRSGMAKQNLAGLAPSHLQASSAFRGVVGNGDSDGGGSGSSSSAASKEPATPAKPLSKLSVLAMKAKAANGSGGSNKRPMEEAAATTPLAGVGRGVAGAAAPAARPSKLAALAAARGGTGSPQPSPVAGRTEETPPPPSAPAEKAKPLSKLQQKMLAARQARTAAGCAAAAPARDGEAMDVDAAEGAQEAAPTCFGSDVAVSTLFPHAAGPWTKAQAGAQAEQQRKSPMPAGSHLLTHVSRLACAPGPFQLAGPFPPTRAVPGGSPFDLFVVAQAPAKAAIPAATAAGAATHLQSGATERVEAIRRAFAGPSPDDVVMKAREGTSLGAHAPAVKHK
ncbi:hypothetical protein ACQY0O_005649 [Thecaphora frezii]